MNFFFRLHSEDGGTGEQIGFSRETEHALGVVSIVLTLQISGSVF